MFVLHAYPRSWLSLSVSLQLWTFPLDYLPLRNCSTSVTFRTGPSGCGLPYWWCTALWILWHLCIGWHLTGGRRTKMRQLYCVHSRRKMSPLRCKMLRITWHPPVIVGVCVHVLIVHVGYLSAFVCICWQHFRQHGLVNFSYNFNCIFFGQCVVRNDIHMYVHTIYCIHIIMYYCY